MVRRASTPQFVGREAELVQLQEAFGRASAGEPTLVLVVGEAGVGKSRLVAQFTAGLPARLTAGACARIGEDGPPYGPLLPILRETGALPRDGDASPHSFVGPTARAWFFQSAVDRIEIEARREPIVAVLEDIQWSDQASRDLLDFIVRCMPPSRLLVIATLRSDELPRGHPVLGFLGEIGRHERVQRIDLGGLDPTSAEELLRSLLGADESTAVLADIAGRADGNPYFLEELAAAARRDERMPATVRDIVESRLADLPPGTQAVAAAIAVAGRGLPERELAVLTGFEEDEVAGLAQAAIDRRVLERDEVTTTYRFRHALIGEVLYGGLRPDERRRLHRVAGELIDRAPGERSAESAAELAHHLDRAGDPAAGLPASIAAAEAAERVYAYPEAARQWSRARAQQAALASAAGGAARSETDLVERHAIAAARAGDHVGAVALERALLAALEAAGDRPAVAACRSRLAMALWDAGFHADVMAVSSAAVEDLAGAPTDRIHATVLAGHARLLMLESRLAEAAAVAGRAIDAAGRHAPELEGGARITRGAAEAGLGRVDSGLAELRLGLDLARASGRPDDIARGLLNLDYAYWSAGLLDEALDLSRQGLNEMRRLGLQSAFGGTFLGNLGENLFLLGEWEDAARMFGQAEVAEEHGMVGVDLRTSSAELAVASGRWADARRLIAEARAIADDVSSSTTSIRLGLVEADLAAWERRWADGLVAVDRAVETMAPEDRATFAPRIAAAGGRLLAEMAAIARAGRDSAKVADLARRAVGYRSLIEDPAPDGPPGGADIPANRAFRLLAIAEFSRLDGGSDRDAWAAAAEAFAEMASPYPVAYCRFRETEARLTDREPRHAASAPIDEAGDIARRLGANPLLREIDALRLRARLPADSSRISRRPATPHPAHGLTPREVEVVGLVAEGQTNRQIASALFITEKTAGLHVSNILTKLGVSNRVEAAGAARRLQLLPLDRETQGDP